MMADWPDDGRFDYGTPVPRAGPVRTHKAEAFLDNDKRVVVVSYFDWEAPRGRIQRGECDGYRPPGNWPFNLTPYRMTAAGAR